MVCGTEGCGYLGHMGQTGQVCAFPMKEEIWPFRCDFQAGKDGVGHINLGKAQFCFLLHSENAQGPPPKSLSPLSVRESRVLKWIMWMPNPGQDSCVLAEVIPVQRTLDLLWDPQASQGSGSQIPGQQDLGVTGTEILTDTQLS